MTIPSTATFLDWMLMRYEVAIFSERGASDQGKVYRGCPSYGREGSIRESASAFERAARAGIESSEKNLSIPRRRCGHTRLNRKCSLSSFAGADQAFKDSLNDRLVEPARVGNMVLTPQLSPDRREEDGYGILSHTMVSFHRKN
jgi:hypothetical protein